MKLLLLMLLCLEPTLVCAHAEGNQYVVTSNFDMSKVSGKWHTILLASDRKEKIEENGSMRLFVEYIQILQNSSLYLKYHKKIKGGCTEISFICDETEEDDVYSYVYDGYNTFDIIETVYSDYVMFYVLNTKNKKKCQVMELYARKRHVSRQLKKKFKKHCEDQGIPKENVLDLSKIDRCLQAKGSQGDQASSDE